MSDEQQPKEPDTDQAKASRDVAKRPDLPKGVAVARNNLSRFGAVLPEHIDAKAFVGAAEAALYSNPQLMEGASSAPQTFYRALMDAAALGHRPGSPEYYLVPRKVTVEDENGKRSVPGIQGIEGYRGIIERMYRSGAVRSVVVREVCEGDQFEYVEGMHDKPIHQIDWFGSQRGDKDHPMKGVYAYAILDGGAVSRVVILSRDDVMAAKAKSDSSGSKYSPWNRQDGGSGKPGLTGRSMWLKTAARRLEPWVPTSVEYLASRLRASAEAAADARANQGGSEPRGVDVDTGEVHDAELVEDGAPPEGSDS